MTRSSTIRDLEPLCRYVVRQYFPPRGHDRDDLMQEARIGAWGALRDYKGDGGLNFRNFARLCIERQVITAIKTANRKKARVLSEAASFDVPTSEESGTLGDVVLASAAADPEQRVLDKERLLEALTLLRMDLSSLELRCFIAMALDGASYEDIAEALTVEVKAVDNALQRARRKLDAAMRDLTCEVCGTGIDWGRRCAECEAAIEFARGLLAA